jgi:hypothetical protein
MPTSWSVLPVRPRTALALVLLAACGGDSPTEPGLNPSPNTPVAIGDTISAGLSASADEATFTFHPSIGGVMALFATADQPIRLLIRDSTAATTSFPISGLLAGPVPLPDQRSNRFAVTAGHTYVIQVTHFESPETSRFRFVLNVVNTAPEHVSAQAEVGQILAGERLEDLADMDEFEVEGHAGDELVAYIQADDSLASGAVRLTVSRGPDTVISWLSAQGGDDIESVATDRFTLPADGTYRVTLEANLDNRPPEPAVGGYRWELEKIDRAPETGSAAVSLGDTVSGSIEHVGDVDEFTLTGAPGAELNFFLQAETNDSTRWIEAQVDGIVTQNLWLLESSGADTSLYGQSIGTAHLPPSGSVTIRIAGRSYGTLQRGGYRFYVHPVNHDPETVPAELALGSSVEETLDVPGDVDEFLLEVPATRLVNLVLESVAGNADLFFTRLDVTGAIALGGFQLFGTEDGTLPGGATDAFELGQNVYRLRVNGASMSGGYRGRYRLSAWVIDSAPESVAPTMIYETPITGEAIDPLGDVDAYTFSGNRGDVLSGSFQALDGPAGHGLFVGIRGGVPDVFAGNGADFGNSVETGRFILPTTGSYQVVVAGQGSNPGNAGTYGFTLHRLESVPEHVAATIAPGADVTGESLDRPGDVDEYTLSGAAGTELQILFYGLPGQSLDFLVATPVTYDSVKGMTLGGSGPTPTGRFRLPAGGQAKVRVYEHRVLGQEYTALGTYRFTVTPIQRAPESVAAAITLGEIVEGEAIATVGDVDEFTFTGTAGQTITAYFQTPQGFSYPFVVLQLLRQGTEDVLGEVISGNPTGSITDQSTGPIVLPASGQYVVRVQGTSDREGLGAYRFLVQ